jgi:lipoyl-dependent peroxiredoxin
MRLTHFCADLFQSYPVKMANDAFFLRARLNFSVPGVDGDLGRELVDAAHGIWLYSKATLGNIDVKITLV